MGNQKETSKLKAVLDPLIFCHQTVTKNDLFFANTYLRYLIDISEETAIQRDKGITINTPIHIASF